MGYIPQQCYLGLDANTIGVFPHFFRIIAIFRTNSQWYAAYSIAIVTISYCNYRLCGEQERLSGK